jgi:ribonucleoside-diphosphate reductase subunit M2
VEHFPCIKRKADWCLRYTERQEPGPEVAAEDLERFRTRDFCRRLIAFACCEGIFFSSSFASIFFMKKRGKLPGLCFSNELISRDEGLHCDFACLLYSQIRDELGEAPLTPEEVRGIVSDAVECEVAQTKDALNVSLLGLNSAEMEQYVKFCADRLLVALGEEKMYEAPQPFDWMNLISLQGKTNFFEKRVGEYSKAGVGVAQEEQVFTLDCEF